VNLTIDLGTSVTKAALWDETGMVGLARSRVPTDHPRPGWAEQDPGSWWTSVVAACQALRSEAPRGPHQQVTAIGFSAARETFVCVDAQGRFDGPAIVWSDRRAGREAAGLDAAGLRRDTGVIIDAGSPLAKLAWLRRHDPDRLDRARWVAAPRDAVVQRMTGRLATDWTLAGRAGFIDLRGEITGPVAGRLPELLRPTDIAGELVGPAAEALGLPVGIPVVMGAGDRPCEAVGSGAGPEDPVASWGTTANLSVPSGGACAPAAATLSSGALGGFLIEFGLSAAGQALDWLATTCGGNPAGLMGAARAVPPGARGVLALPWLNGARAPWWKPAAGGGFLNVGPAHGPADLARALIESVACEMATCAGLLAHPPRRLIAAGSGTASEVWLSALGATAGLPVVVRRTSEAASVGAHIVTAAALGRAVDVDAVNPVVDELAPSPELVGAYRDIRTSWLETAEAVLSIDRGQGSDPCA
jgi:xylulokinase